MISSLNPVASNHRDGPAGHRNAQLLCTIPALITNNNVFNVLYLFIGRVLERSLK